MGNEQQEPNQTFEDMQALRALIAQGRLVEHRPDRIATYRSTSLRSEGLLVAFADRDGEPEYFCFLHMSLVALLHEAFAIELARRNYHGGG